MNVIVSRVFFCHYFVVGVIFWDGVVTVSNSEVVACRLLIELPVIE